MKVSEADILVAPGFGNSGPDHWQSRWQAKLSTARRIDVPDWNRADRIAWIEAVAAGASTGTRPVIIIAHAAGVAATAHAAPGLAGRVAGAFLVAPMDWDRPDVLSGGTPGFAPIPLAPLPFPSVLVASSDDPCCPIQRAADFADAWGSELVNAGEAGRIDAASGHGPWPEGLMKFAGFMSALK